ncbi:MAG: 30S ribosomal protein S9, partial [Desulfobacula sp.]|nr:30S ribosomal protein S9 [Desulfobacula sp.]
MESGNVFYATGKRKDSVAKVWLAPGNGKVVVNNK